MTRYKIGTSGYSYKEWKGTFYPEGVADNGMLRYYAERFNTVEVNYTFYRMPSVRMLQGWAKETGPDFTITLKAPRRITHDLRLRDAADLLSDFCEIASALKNKLGVILFQLPPFLKRDLPRLEDFLHQLTPGLRVAFEFRNQSWFVDEVYECLRRFGVALCIVDSSEREVPWEATADFGYFRLRRPDYSEEELVRCAQQISERARSWQDAFIYFKHEAAGRGPVLATRLRELLEEQPPVAAEAS